MSDCPRSYSNQKAEVGLKSTSLPSHCPSPVPSCLSGERGRVPGEGAELSTILFLWLFLGWEGDWLPSKPQGRPGARSQLPDAGASSSSLGQAELAGLLRTGQVASGKEAVGLLQRAVLRTALFTSLSSHHQPAVPGHASPTKHGDSPPGEQDRQALCPHSVAESPHVCRVSEIWPRPEKDLVLELAFEQMNEQRNKQTKK